MKVLHFIFFKSRKHFASLIITSTIIVSVSYFLFATNTELSGKTNQFQFIDVNISVYNNKSDARKSQPNDLLLLKAWNGTNRSNRSFIDKHCQQKLDISRWSVGINTARICLLPVNQDVVSSS